MKCTECGKELTAEEQSQGTCSSCGKKIETPATSNTSEEIYTTLVGQSLKIVGLIVLVGGFIGSFLIGKDDYGYLSYYFFIIRYTHNNPHYTFVIFLPPLCCHIVVFQVICV